MITNAPSTIRKSFAAALIAAICFSTFPTAHAISIATNRDDARNDPNVVDSFLTMEETIASHSASLSTTAAVQPNTIVEVGEPAVTWSTDVFHEPSPRMSERLRPLLVAASSFDLRAAPQSIDIISSQLHPAKGEEWAVRFRTEGVGELRITPADAATMQDDEFIGLRCGDKEYQVTIGEGDSIIAENWNCDDIAQVSHLTLREGRHALYFEFGPASAVAHNGPNSPGIMGAFKKGVVTATFAGNASINARQPNPAAGDLMVAIIAIRPQTDIVSTPSGWTSLGSVSGTDGAAEGSDTGSVRLYTMYKVADGTEGTANQTFSETGTPSVWGVFIHRYRSASRTYDIATSSISINADSTAMGGTFSNESLQLRSGDIALLASASNGDLNTGYSGWAMTATGMTFGTWTEILDSNSATGNQIRYAAAQSYGTSGTANVSTVSAVITAAAAASGASTIVRIRQGEGANRKDTFVRSCGLPVTGSTSVAPSYPEHEIGDLLVLLVEVRNSTVTPTNPASWSSIASYTGGTGTFGADAGNAKIQAWYRQATSSVLTGTQSVTLTSGNTAAGQICAVHRDGIGLGTTNGQYWAIDSDGGSDNTGGSAAWSATGSGIDYSAADGGDVVIVGSGINSDAYTYTAHALSVSGVSFTDLGESTNFVTSTGNDSALSTVVGEVSSGSVSGVAPTFTMTASGSGTNAPTGASIILAIRGITVPFTGRAIRLVGARTTLYEGTRIIVR